MIIFYGYDEMTVINGNYWMTIISSYCLDILGFMIIFLDASMGCNDSIYSIYDDVLFESHCATI